MLVRTALESRRSEYDVGIGYGDDIAKEARVILDALAGVEGVQSDPAPDVVPWDLAGSTVNLRGRWWTDPRRAQLVLVQGRVIAAVKNALTKVGIDLLFPTRVVLWHDQTEVVDGDRTRQREGWPAGDKPPQSRYRQQKASEAPPETQGDLVEGGPAA